MGRTELDENDEYEKNAMESKTCNSLKPISNIED